MPVYRYATPKSKLKPGRDGVKHEYWHTRIKYDVDPKYGTRLPDRDVYSSISKKDCIEKAEKICSEYKPIKPESDYSSVLFIDYLKNEFIPAQRERVGKPKPRGIVAGHFIGRMQRLTNWLIDPDDSQLRDIPLRRKKIADITSKDMRQYFGVEDLAGALEKAGCTQYTRRFLKSDLMTALIPLLDYIDVSRQELFDGIKVGKPKGKKKTPFDVDAIFDKLKDESIPIMSRAICATALMILCRPSELFALKWGDIDFEKKTISISRAVRRSLDGGYETSQGTKTDEDGRVVPMPLIVSKLLSDLGDGARPQSWVFTTSTGSQLNSGNVIKVWGRIKIDMGMPKDADTFYRFKHTGNSFLQSRNIAPEDIRSVMGHSANSVLAETTYWVALQGRERAIATAWDDAFSERIKSTE